MPRLSSLLALLLSPLPALGQGFSPEDAVKRMKLPPGFSVRVVAAEPMVRQPVSMSFDERGRLWVLQYLQYPNYAGLKPVKQDQYLRTIWDKLPDPPPRGPKGADRLTILSDPDANGVFTKSKDFATGMNIASGFCLGDGGVYVAQPPYLLFYPDKNRDDVPDGDPEVLLTGFGMDDTHSLANSLQWGPDGWLYGAAGSTSTSRIKPPVARSTVVPQVRGTTERVPGSPEYVEFQQGLWRYHPKTKAFELFSEGGGNTYGLDFDKNGQAIAGTNWGGFAMLHQMQGAYYVKGFSKHGPLHNPHTYGYFDHVPYTGFKGGHVTCGGVVYQADAYPTEFRDQYIGANLLSNAIYWHKLEPFKSSFKARHGGDLLEANDTWFRPVDLLTGPDGCVYVADFYDRRAAHLDPIDNWDRTNGRVYRIEYNGPPKTRTFDLSKSSPGELVELLKHPNKWWRDEARRQMRERGADAAALTKILESDKGELALEALWALYQIGEFKPGSMVSAFEHPNDYVRAWAVRLALDKSRTVQGSWVGLPMIERSTVVLAQLACSARRTDPETSRYIVQQLLANPACGDDPQLPLLIWWAIESQLTRSGGAVTNSLKLRDEKTRPLGHFLAERLARRVMAGDFSNGHLAAGELLASLPEESKPVALRGVAEALKGRTLKVVPDDLAAPLDRYWLDHPDDPTITEIMARMSVPAARITLREKVANAKAPDAERVKAIDTLRGLRDAKSQAVFLAQLKSEKSDAVRVALIAGLEAFDDAAIGDAVLAGYAAYPPAVKKRAVQLLVARPAWAAALLAHFDAGKFPKTDLTLDHAKTAVALNDAKVTSLVEKHFGRFAPSTPGEKQARISWLGAALSRNGPTDPTKGKGLFTKHCAACHTLHGEGGKVGPDLTTADRKNRGYVLTHSVDPSAYIRPEYVVHTVATADGRKLSGIVAESTAESLTLVNVVNDQPVRTVVAKKDIDELQPSRTSLMPEKLLDTLKDAEVADLLAYIASDAKPAGKKLKLALVSGSFEYKSDESLAAFQKHLEATYPVECVRVFAKAEKDKALAGVEKLSECDAPIFYTRRLQLDGEALDAVKAFVNSKKPLVGVRTASHGFQNWLAMDKEVFGGNYGGHFGAKMVCDVTVAPLAKDHPVLKGVAGFKSNGSLYKNPNVAGDVTVLLNGAIPGNTEPVAWVREKDGRRVFYTSLGHPDDFKNENFTRLLVNGLMWATKAEWK
jgi:putative membrane-bound dehydrogenase-like protein